MMAAATERSKIGLALAGGGPVGGIYEVGAMAALAEALDGVDFTDFDIYVGVSSGAFISAAVANGLAPATLARMLVENDTDDVFDPEMLLRPAFGEYVRRALSVPVLMWSSLRQYLSDPWHLRLVESFQGLSHAIPTGVFNNAGIDHLLSKLLSTGGRSNDFRRLKHRLFLVATDLDTGESVAFGSEGHDDVPISVAVQASSALPGLYPPVQLHGRHLVDGALRRTMHGSVALDEDIDLFIGLNPLVPYDGHSARGTDGERLSSVTEGGLPMVLSQTFRTLLQSRMQVGLAKYAQQYAHSDQLIFEPNHDDAEVFFTNAFSYSSRQRVCEHAYRVTLRDLGRQREALKPILTRLGLRLRDELLDAPEPSLMDGVRRAYRPHTGTTARLSRALDDIEELIEARSESPRKGRRR